MELLIKFPTRNRPNKFLMVLDKYVNYLEDKSTKIIVSCDNDDMSMQQEHIIEAIKQYDNVNIFLVIIEQRFKQ